MPNQSVRLWLLLFLSLYVLVSEASDPDIVKDEAKQEGSSGRRLSWSEGNDRSGRQGAIDVRKALVELQLLQNSGSRFWLVKNNKRSGLARATAYYAKKGFVLLFMNGPKQHDYLDQSTGKKHYSKPLAKAVRLLEGAAEEENADAIFLLAEMNFYGNFTHPRNFQEAFKRYQELASLNGNSTAQHMIGYMYATGIGNSVQRDQAKALMYYTFAARGGNIRSEMTAAYRHHAGIGTPRNCNEAAVYYKKVADKAIEFARSGPPGGLPLIRDAFRLADEEGGVYGDGASFSSSGINSNKHNPNSDQNAAFDDVMEYLDLMSRKGDPKATFNLGRFHYEGSRTMKRNFRIARRYFLTVARTHWGKDDTIISKDVVATGKLASKAAAYIGRFYLRGEGVEQNYAKALKWFRMGLQNGDAFCQYEIGLMHLLGLGLREDALIAASYFKEAAKQDWPAAQVHLGKLFLDQGDLTTAISYFELGARHGHIEALYHLAEINNNGVGRERSCGHATAYYKVVAEKAEGLHSSFEEANEAYDNGDKEAALLAYMMAAEQGYEQAQANVAYLLDEQKSIVSLDTLLPWKKQRSAILQNAVLALAYWTRSAKQSNIDSVVKMGDYYLKGYGAETDLEKAAACYQSAAEMQQSAQAAWNLGWMHENGVGVEKDYHLAMRFYVQALETNSESYLPVQLSLTKLKLRSWWNGIIHGGINPIQPEPETTTHLSWSQWLARFLEDEHPDHSHHHPDVDDEFDTRVHDPMPGGDDYYDEIDEGMFESLVIISLAGALAFLVYYRQQRQQNHRMRMEEQRRRHEYVQAAAHPEAEDRLPGQQADGGFFPPVDDPNFNVWRAGGIGH